MTPTVIYRAVALGAGLVALGLLFRELVTLLLAVLITVIVAVALAAATDRLQRTGVPRALGALLSLLVGVGTLVGVLILVIPPFVDEVQQFVDDVPQIVRDLEADVDKITGSEQGETGDRVQEFLQKYVDDPERLVGPLTSIGLNVAGILGAVILILITAFYIAVRPEPLLQGVTRLFPPDRRAHVRHVMARLRGAWLGWLRGVMADMFVTGVLVYAALSLIGLEFAGLFAILSALLVFIPYFGAILGGIPPVLLALTDSPGKALLVLVAYVLIQQVEGNVVIPLVMARTVRLHPAVIAVGVVLVGQLFGFVGLFVAVPILSAIVILTEEFYVKPMESARESARGDPLQPAQE